MMMMMMVVVKAVMMAMMVAVMMTTTVMTATIAAVAKDGRQFSRTFLAINSLSFNWIKSMWNWKKVFHSAQLSNTSRRNLKS